MGEIWTLWADCHPQLEKSLATNTQDSLERRVNEICSDAAARRSIVMKLAVSVRSSDLSQEIIRTWYDFGPFPIDPEVDEIVTLTPTKDEMVAPSRLMTLQDRLQELEQKQREFDTGLKLASQRANQSLKQTTGLSEIPSRLATLEIQLNHTSGLVNDVQSALGRLSTLAEASQAEVARGKSDLAETRRQISDLNEAQSQLFTTSQSHSDIMDELSQAFNRSQHEIAELKESIGLLAEERREVVASDEVGPSTVKALTHTPGGGLSYPSPNFIAHRVCISGDQMPLDGPDSALVHLANNLNALGIIRPHARMTACDVLTGLLAGQVVCFDGSMALVVAERCAVSLAEIVYRVRVPVGLVEQQVLEDLLGDLRQESSNYVVALILEGANRSALEVYGSALRHLVTERSLRTTTAELSLSLLLFATLVDGPATMPERRSMAELGPILTTDDLSWMDRNATVPTPGVFQREAWLHSCRPPVIDSDWRDLLAPAWLLRSGGVLWRRGLMLAMHFSAQFAAESDSALEASASNMAFAWLIPMAEALAPERMKEALELVKPDDRAVILLERIAPELVEE